MDGYYFSGMSQDWTMCTAPTVIDYNHQRTEPIQNIPMNQPPAPVGAPQYSSNFNELVQLQLQMLNNKQPTPPTNVSHSTKPQLTSFGIPKPVQESSASDKYNPFVEEIIDLDMEISDDEKELENSSTQSKVKKPSGNTFAELHLPIRNNMEVKSGAAFYQGLILFIPPFEQLSHTYRGSPALKMLYASFDFSFKTAVRIDTKQRENEPNVRDATVYFRDNIIATGSGFMPHVEASVRALELLSETCYTIQAKEDYFLKCKLIDAESMNTLNLRKWETVSDKYPKIVEVTKDSHIQKTFAVFLDSHTSSGIYEDIVCCNLTREDVNNIKGVVEFFRLNMMPCSVSTNLSKKHTPCVVSIHKYSSAKNLLDILVECGGENDKFILHPPDTFKDFYKLHPKCWDPDLKNKADNDIAESKTTLEDPFLQAVIMKPYENVIPELFQKHKTLPKVEKPSDNSSMKTASDDFMKNTFQIDMAQSKSVAPVERMQLLLKYMEQLQEYGSRVLTSGRADMIKIYHNAIDNVRKDLDECRKDIEKEQKNKEKTKETTKETSSHTVKARSPVSKRRTPPRRRSRSPVKKSLGTSKRSTSPRRRGRSRSPRRSVSPRRKARSKSPRKSLSPRRRARSKSPRRHDRIRRSPSPRRRPRSPRRERSRSPRRSHRGPSPKRGISPSKRNSPQPSHSVSKEDDTFIPIFKDQFRRYMDVLRRFRIEIEDTPIEWRGKLKDRLFTLSEQLGRFNREMRENPTALGDFQYELEICKDELTEQNDLITRRPGPNDLAPVPLVTPNRVFDLPSYPTYGYGLYPRDNLHPDVSSQTPSMFPY